MMSKVCCIIPAYNEADRIGGVLDVIHNHPFIEEILVIDDASKDATSDVAKKYNNVTVFTNEKNMGKSFSISRGIEASHGEYIIFLDADLVGLTKNNIDNLLFPVLSEKTTISMSLRGNAPFCWRIIGLDYISGERVIPRNLFDNQIDNIKKLPKFGLEVFINDIIIRSKYSISVINFPNVSSPYKYKKYGMLKGAIAEAEMMKDIFFTISPLHALSQIYQMSRLKI